MKKVKKLIAASILCIGMFMPIIPVMASSYEINYNFDSRLVGYTRYYGNGGTFAISTDGTCNVNTNIDIYLYKSLKKNSSNVKYIGKSYNSANGKDTAHITSNDGAGDYYTIFTKPKSTYGHWCTGTGKISDGN